MKYLKKFNENSIFLTDEGEIREYVKSIRSTIEANFPIEIDPNGIVNSERTFTLRSPVAEQRRPWGVSGLVIPRLKVQFGRIDGDFRAGSSGLTSLEGLPSYVTGDVSVRFCRMKSLKGSPNFVGGEFICGETPITNLIGSPEHVGGDFMCQECELLTSLEGLPKTIGGRMSFYYCGELWDPTGLRDLVLGEESYNRSEFQGTPLHFLRQVFGPIKNLQESLDYNYIRPPKTFTGDQIPKSLWDLFAIRGNRITLPCIDLFRFKQALAEFDIDLHPVHFTMLKYAFINESGEWVDFDGNF